MCTDSTAEEDSVDGSLSVDSVVIRIIKQQSSCVCNITIDYQILPLSVFYLRKYGGRVTSAPTTAACGLVLDVEKITPSGAVENLDSITCLTGYDNRSFTSLDKQVFRLTSRRTDDAFMSGYCLQIYKSKLLNRVTSRTLVRADVIFHKVRVQYDTLRVPICTHIHTFFYYSEIFFSLNF